MKRIFGLFLVLGVVIANGQALKKPAEFYSNTIEAKDIKAHLEVLASDSFMGRETGTEGQRLAADYIENHFKSLGLKPVVDSGYQQSFEIDIIEPAEVALTLNSAQFSFPDDLLYLGSVNTQELNFSEVVYVGYGVSDSIWDDYADLDVAGKVVVLRSGEPKRDSLYVLTNSKTPSNWTYNPGLKIELARKKGAVGIIEFNPELNSIISRYTRYLMRSRVALTEDSKEIKAPFVMISDSGFADALNLKAGDLDAWKNGKEVSIGTGSLTYKNNSRKGSSTNVLGYLPGTEKKDEVLVITAHYDHLGMRDSLIYNGADDDGSGTSAVLELAEAFQQASYEGYKCKRSILFMLVSGEEKGLLGSQYYTEHPIFELENTVTNLNIDMIGRRDPKYKDDPNYVYVIGSEMLSSDLKKISESQNRKHTKLKLDYTFDDPNDPNRFYYRSDHYNFAKNNIPVIFYFTGTHDDYHKPTDTVEKIEFDKMEKITRLVFHTAWEIANRDERLKVDKLN
ncbi:MAG: M28 family peptidase [Luteibaculum sp.]